MSNVNLQPSARTIYGTTVLHVPFPVQTVLVRDFSLQRAARFEKTKKTHKASNEQYHNENSEFRLIEKRTMKLHSLLLLLVTIVPTEAGPLCNRVLDRVMSGSERPIPFDCRCGLRIFRRIRFSCEATVCLDKVDGVLNSVFPIDLPINYEASTCLKPSFKGRVPKRMGGDIDAGGCTGKATMVVNVDPLVEQYGPDGSTRESLDLPETLDFKIPNACLDVTTDGRPGLRDPSLNLSGCSASIDGKSCPCNLCNGGSGIELGQECLDILSTIVPEELTNIDEFADIFNFNMGPVCIGGDNLFSGRGVVDIMLTPYLSEL